MEDDESVEMEMNDEFSEFNVEESEYLPPQQQARARQKQAPKKRTKYEEQWTRVISIRYDDLEVVMCYTLREDKARIEGF